MLIVLILFAAAFLALGAWRKLIQLANAKRQRIKGSNSIEEAFYVRVGGIDQWVQIRGEGRANPVLLVVHGGPGVSYVPFSNIFKEWEKHFTVVQWDQRGAGKTYGRSGKRVELSIEQIVRDGIEVVEHLQSRLGQQKLILLGHSWGSIIGLRMADRRPDLFMAYVGTGQVVAMSRSEPASYELLLKQARANGDAKAVRAVEALGAPPYQDLKTWMGKQRMIMMTSPPPVEGQLPGLFAPAFFAPGYSIRDSVNWFLAFNFSMQRLYSEFMAADAAELRRRFEVPMLFLQGEIDAQAPTQTVEEFFITLEAPRKELALLKGEGHAALLSTLR